MFHRGSNTLLSLGSICYLIRLSEDECSQHSQIFCEGKIPNHTLRTQEANARHAFCIGYEFCNVRRNLVAQKPPLTAMLNHKRQSNPAEDLGLNPRLSSPGCMTM